MDVICINNVSLSIRKHEILKKININFEKAKIHGFIGRNGSGKTMLMKWICGIVPPTAGEIYVNDQRIGKDTDIPKNVGVIIETPGFIRAIPRIIT